MSSEVKHEHRAHSMLSASGAERWMNCTPSARKEEGLANVESEYAKEGTLAHELGETELKLHFGLITKEDYYSRVKAIEANELYQPDMPEFVDIYVSYCIEQVNYYKSFCKHVEISIEEKIDLTHYIPEGFGSNDFVIVADNHIEVIDLKYGRGVSVSAIDNPQLKLYGLGSVFKHRLSYNMEDIKLTVVQPRTDSISSFVINVDVLEEWADREVVSKAKMAFAGEGELKSGKWCKFCKFKPMCNAIKQDNLKILQSDFGDPDKLSDSDLKEIYEKSEQVISWLNSIGAYIHTKLMNREEFPGYKLVSGRSTRKIYDQEKVIKILEDNEYKKEQFMSEPKLLGITHIEKLLGKKDTQELLGELISKTEPKPSLAKSEDKRDSFFSSVTEDFKNNII